jgi:hypothetical protein
MYRRGLRLKACFLEGTPDLRVEAYYKPLSSKQSICHGMDFKCCRGVLEHFLFLSFVCVVDICHGVEFMKSTFDTKVLEK